MLHVRIGIVLLPQQDNLPLQALFCDGVLQRRPLIAVPGNVPADIGIFFQRFLQGIQGTAQSLLLCQSARRKSEKTAGVIGNCLGLIALLS